MSSIEGSERGGAPPDPCAALARGRPRGGGRLAGLAQLADRGLRSAVFSCARYLARPALGLVATPIFLANLGLEQYGIWMTVNTVMSVTAIADFGILDSIVRYVSKYHATGDEAGIVRTVRSAVTVCAAIALACMALLVAFAPYAASDVFSISGPDQGLVVAALRVSGIYFVFGFVNAAFRMALRGCHRFDLDAKLEIAFEVLTTLTNLALAYTGHGLVAILASMSAWSAIAVCVSAVTLKRVAAPSLVFWPLLSRGLIGESASYAAFIWSQGLTAMILANFDRLLIASQLGPNVLAYYAVALQLAQQIHGLLVNALAFLFPMFSEVNEAGSAASLRTLYKSSFLFTLVATLLIAVPLFVFGPLLLRLWLGPEVAAMAHAVVRILVCYYVVVTLTIVPHYFLNGIGNSRLNAIFGLASAAVSVAAALILTPRLGASGAALSRLGIAPVCCVLWAMVHHRFGLGPKWTLLPVAVTGAAIAAAIAYAI